MELQIYRQLVRNTDNNLDWLLVSEVSGRKAEPLKPVGSDINQLVSETVWWCGESDPLDTYWT